jgi:signal peptidase I
MFFQTKKKQNNSWQKETGSFFTFLLLVLLIRTVLFSPFKIPTGSMIPTLLVGDQLIVSKFSYGVCNYSLLGSGWIHYFSGRIGKIQPKRGDIAVFTYPDNTTIDYIKRVVGVPGDEVQMKEGKLFINGQEAQLTEVQKDFKANDGFSDIRGTVYEEILPASKGHPEKKHLILKIQPFGESRLDNTRPVRVPEKHYYMMGDNRDGSADSRDMLGAVPDKYFIGPALFLFLSLSTDWSWFKPWLWPFQIRYTRIGTWLH